MGGATNHRMGLWDAAMIKDNHVAVAGSVEEAVRRAVAAGIADILVEVDRVDQVAPALGSGATHLLLDNMGPEEMRECVAIVGGQVPKIGRASCRESVCQCVSFSVVAVALQKKLNIKQSSPHT